MLRAIFTTKKKDKEWRGRGNYAAALREDAAQRLESEDRIMEVCGLKLSP